MEEQAKPRPASSATRRRPVSSPANRNTESRLQRSSRPVTAQVHGSSINEGRTPLTRPSHAPREAITAQDSTFSLPVLRSEQASTVTLLQDDLELQTEPLPPPIPGQLISVVDNPPDYEIGQEKIQNLLYLTEGETDLDSDKEIPDIFTETNQLKKHAAIEGLREQLEEDNLKPYVHKFTTDMQKESLLVGKMSREEIEEEERRLQLEYLAYQQQEADKQLERQRQIIALKEVAKKELSKTVKRKKRAVKKKEAQVVQSSMIQRRELYSAFDTAQAQLIRALKARKAEIKTLYGDLQRAAGYYADLRGCRWRVDWTRAPQPVQIKLKSLRGVRDKLPGSCYVLLVSLYDRLGGSVLRWSRLTGQQWAASSLPMEHAGHYYSTHLEVDQSVYTVLPPQVSVRPSMVLVFEVWMLRGAVSPTDRVVGWGAFPVCDHEFRTVEGKYKCPLLRGPVDPTITKHSQIEKLMKSDIENWLCNLYFEVIRLPRYLAGMQEYEVELQLSSRILGYSDLSYENRLVDTDNGDSSVTATDAPRIVFPSAANESSSEEALEGIPSGPVPRLGYSRPLQSTLPRALCSPPVQRDQGSSQGEDSERPRDSEGFSPVADQPGLYYKVHTFNPLEEKQLRAQTLYPHTRLLQERGCGQLQDVVLSEEEELLQYSVAVRRPFSDSVKKQRRICERVQYIGRQLLSELGPWQWRRLEFWSVMLFLLLCWWVRLYLHYVGQYAFLRVVRIPVNRFEFYAHTVILNYQSSLLFTREIIGIVLLGPALNTILFCLLVLISWLVQILFGRFPDLGSQFILAYGVQALLDPYWVFLVDMALMRYQAPLSDVQTADVTKLYWHFDRLENNGVVGIFLLVFLYLLVSFFTLACLYLFFLKVHKNGLLIDVYHRLCGSEEVFFAPRDMEVSNHELHWVCRKAEQWRGAEGERRKVIVRDYVCTCDNESEESTLRGSGETSVVSTHVSIYTLHIDGLRELYRQFLRLEDGSIIEVFGELSNIPGISPGLRNVLTSRAHSPPSTSSTPITNPPPSPAHSTTITPHTPSITDNPSPPPTQHTLHTDDHSLPSIQQQVLDTQEKTTVSIVENKSSPTHIETETDSNIESTSTIEGNNVSTYTMDTLMTVSTSIPFDAETKSASLQLDSVPTSRERTTAHAHSNTESTAVLMETEQKHLEKKLSAGQLV